MFEVIGKIVAGLVVFVLAGLSVIGVGILFAYPLMWAINYAFAPSLVAAVFGVPQIGVLKAFAVSFVAGVLFKSSTTVTK